MSCCFWLSLLSGLQVCRIYPGLHTGVSLQRKWSQWLITLGTLAVYHGQMCTRARAGTIRLKGEEVRALKQLVVLTSIPVVLHEWHLLLWLLPGRWRGPTWPCHVLPPSPEASETGHVSVTTQSCKICFFQVNGDDTWLLCRQTIFHARQERENNTLKPTHALAGRADGIFQAHPCENLPG